MIALKGESHLKSEIALVDSREPCRLHRTNIGCSKTARIGPHPLVLAAR